MGISTIGGAAAASIAQEYFVVPNSTKTLFSYKGKAGVYRVRAYAGTTSTPTGTIDFLDSNYAVVATKSLVDDDSGNTSNSSIAVIRTVSDFSFITIQLGGEATVEIVSGPGYSGVPISPTVYTTSQSVTVSGTGVGYILGGGGSGKGEWGNGGGSGRITTFSVTPGTYSLVVGAGGPSGYTPGNGGTTTFNGFSALGGNHGSNSGTGGSGGGVRVGAASGSGGANGANGANNPGSGSGVTMPWYQTAGAGGAGGYNGGSAGGLYGGGGSAGDGGASGAGESAAAGTGGGGGGGGYPGGAGGAGGSGRLVILLGV